MKTIKKVKKKQKELALAFFENPLATQTPPKKHECLKLKEINTEDFHNKSWEKIKIFIVNTYKKKKWMLYVHVK